MRDILENKEPETEQLPLMKNPEESPEIIEAVEEIKAWVKKTIQEWHNKVAPDYVFVTETAAVPYGYLLKEAWKGAYPDEECPDFYRIDPKATAPKGASKDKIAEGLERYFSNRIKKDNAKIIVFDEGSQVPLMPSREFIPESGKRRKIPSLRTAADCIEAYGFTKNRGEVWVTRDTPDPKGAQLLYGYDSAEIRGIIISKRPTSKLFGLSEGESFSSLREKSEDEQMVSEDDLKKIAEEGNFTLAGRIVKTEGQRKRAIKFVKQLITIGIIAGTELRGELEKGGQG